MNRELRSALYATLGFAGFILTIAGLTLMDPMVLKVAVTAGLLVLGWLAIWAVAYQYVEG